MKVAIVLLDSLLIPYVYDAPEPSQNLYGGDWGSPEVTVHLSVPEDFNAECLMAVRDGDQVTLVPDPAKVQAKLGQAWQELRARRNALLAASDWTVLADAQTQKDAWFAYRQALRDLPGTLTDPTNVTWPTPP